MSLHTRIGRIITPFHIAEVVAGRFSIRKVIKPIRSAVWRAHRSDHLASAGLAFDVNGGVFLPSADLDVVVAIEVVGAIGCLLVGLLNTGCSVLLACR